MAQKPLNSNMASQRNSEFEEVDNDWLKKMDQIKKA